MDILQFMFLREKIVNLLGEVDGSLGEEWAITGMECPVTECPSGSHHCSTFGGYWQHFQKFHTNLCHCSTIWVAGIRKQKMSDIRRHVRKFHPKLTFCIPKETVMNDKYVDPKRFRRPRRRVHHEVREKARLAR